MMCFKNEYLEKARYKLEEVEKRQRIEERKLEDKFFKEKYEIKKLIRSLIWSKKLK